MEIKVKKYIQLTNFSNQKKISINGKLTILDEMQNLAVNRN